MKKKPIHYRNCFSFLINKIFILHFILFTPTKYHGIRMIQSNSEGSYFNFGFLSGPLIDHNKAEFTISSGKMRLSHMCGVKFPSVLRGNCICKCIYAERTPSFEVSLHETNSTCYLLIFDEEGK